MIEICPLASVDKHAIEALLDAAFGTNRKMRTAYLLRKDVYTISGLSFGIIDDGILVGSIQCWPLHITNSDGVAFPLVLLGPVAVSPNRQNQGLGHKLMNAALKAASAATPPMVMIGDPEYYGRFGFIADETAGWELPGPVEQRRLLMRNVDAQVLPNEGILAPAKIN
jgi:predicted N-acetyltransferase YhbS